MLLDERAKRTMSSYLGITIQLFVVREHYVSDCDSVQILGLILVKFCTSYFLVRNHFRDLEWAKLLKQYQNAGHLKHFMNDMS